VVAILPLDAPDVGECGYAESVAFARDLLLDKEVVATADPGTTPMTKDGRHKLFLAPIGGADYSKAALVAGWARFFYEDGWIARGRELNSDEIRARVDNRGMWGCPGR
jgi:endonuclease YncB( thermonuclease family)